jgi:hypothetical protein
VDDKNAEEIKASLIRIDTHVGELGKRLEKHDERLTRAESDIIEERGMRQGMERAMGVEHSRLHDKIESLTDRFDDSIGAVKEIALESMTLLRDHTKIEDGDRKKIIWLLVTLMFGVFTTLLAFFLREAGG